MEANMARNLPPKAPRGWGFLPPYLPPYFSPYFIFCVSLAHLSINIIHVDEPSSMSIIQFSVGIDIGNDIDIDIGIVSI